MILLLILVGLQVVAGSITVVVGRGAEGVALEAPQ